jgi:hypothetical protein
MKEEQDATPEYLKGFNSGYILAQHEPELLQQLESSLDKNADYIHGLKMGKKQYDREIVLRQIRLSQQKNRGQEKEI